MNTRIAPHFVGRFRCVGVVLVVLAAVLCVCSSALADSTDAAARARTPKNLAVQAFTGPFRYVVGGTVTVTDPVSGETMGTGRTSRHGQTLLRVAGEPSKTAPFVVTVTGGRVQGRAFTGTLRTIVPELSLSLQRVDPSTTAASKMPLARTGGFGKNLASVRRALGFTGANSNQGLWLYSYVVGDQQLLRAVKNAGGYDAFSSMLARTARRGERVKGLRTRVLQMPHRQYYRAYKQRMKPKKKSATPAKGTLARSTAPSTRQSSSTTLAAAAGAPCTSTFAPPATPGSSQSDLTAVADFSVETTAAMISLYATGEGLGGEMPAMAEGVTGFALDEVNSAIDPTTGETETTEGLSAISDQLDCISNQVHALQTSVDMLSLQVSTSSVSTCEGAITTAWNNYYLPTIYGLADGSVTATSTNSQLSLTMNTISQLETTCSNAINEMLFNTGGGSTSAWQSLVADYEAGDYVSTDTVALAPSSVQAMQLFLSYWGTLEYQQAVMTNDYFNYMASVLNTPAAATQSAYMAQCASTPSVSSINGTATNWCQWQQNIADVWPSTTYSDEVALWTPSVTAASKYAISGSAVSAVPAGMGATASSPATAANVTPQTVASLCSGVTGSGGSTKGTPMCTTALSSSYPTNTLSSYNALKKGTMATPYQLWSAPQVAKTAVLAAGSANMAALSGFFNSQLNGSAGQVTQSSATSTTTASNGGVSNSTTSTTVNGAILGSTSSPSWQLLGSGSTLSNYNTGASSCGAGCTNIAFGCQVLANGTFYSPSPWNGSGTYTITEQTISTYGGGYLNQNSVCSTGMFPSSPPAAYLLSRPWTQGSAWPGTPVITSTTINNPNAAAYNLAASNCPAGGCSWGLGSTLPTGWSLTTAGYLTVVCGSPTATITLTVSNNYAFGYGTVTVTPPPACSPPVVTSTSLTATYPTPGAQLVASNCGSGCTFYCENTGEMGCITQSYQWWEDYGTTQVITTLTNGTTYCGWIAGEQQTIYVTATNSWGLKSASTPVSVTCNGSVG
ncbi:MAG: hypothetical protein WCN97_00750 [Thermoleophilia bacterium]